MNESAPLKRPIKTFAQEGMTDITPIGKNVYRVTVDGKYWLLKTAYPGSFALIRREYELMCNLSHPFIASAAADSIGSPDIVRYRDDAFAIRNTFVEKTYQYRQTISDTDMQFVCDTVYARLLGRLNEMMIRLPWK